MFASAEPSSGSQLSWLVLAMALGSSGCGLFEASSESTCVQPELCGRDAEAGTDAEPMSGDGGVDGGAGDASACDRCSAGTVCDERSGQCVQCNSDGDCGQGRCDTESNQCVECLTQEDCGSGEVCSISDHSCVQCVSGDDCEAETPVCDEGTCVGCTSDTHCGGETPLCDQEARVCVQCLAQDDCLDPEASRCDQGQCRACTRSRECGHLSGLMVCDIAGDTARCVQCTGTEYGTCGVDSENTGKPFVCDSLARTCSDQTEASSGLCGECVSDAQCPKGQLCVLQEFEETIIGYFCMWQRAADIGGAPDSCTAARPYRETVTSARSIDGTEGDICALRVSTCTGHAHFDSAEVDCAPGGVPDDSLCGESNVSDAYCRALPPPDDAVYRCAVPCLSNDDCRVGTNCDIASNLPYCEL